MLKKVIALYLLLTCGWLAAATVADGYLGELPASTRFVIGCKPAPFLVQHRKLRPKEANAITTNYAKLNLDVNAFTFAGQFGDDKKHTAEFFETSLTFEQLATRIRAAEGVRTTAELTYKNRTILAIPSPDSPNITLYLGKMQSGRYLIADKPAFEWAFHTTETLGENSTLARAIPSLRPPNATAWMAVVPFDEMFGTPENAKKVPVTLKKINVIGATLYDNAPEFIMRSKVDCVDSTVAESFRKALQLTIFGVAMSFNDPALTQTLRNGITIRRSDTLCAVAAKADETTILKTYHDLYRRFAPKKDNLKTKRKP